MKGETVTGGSEQLAKPEWIPMQEDMNEERKEEDENSHSEDMHENNTCLVFVKRKQRKWREFWQKNRQRARTFASAVLACLYAVYVGYAMYYRFGDEGSIRLLCITCAVVGILLVRSIWNCWASSAKNQWGSCIDKLGERASVISWYSIWQFSL